MRRTPLVGLLAFSVLGFSGCASASRRLDWSAPSAVGAPSADPSARPRFSWWPGPKAEATAADSGPQVAQVNRVAPPAASATIPGDVWPEHRPDWLARYFPHFSRLWNGNAAESSPHDAPAADTIRVSSRSRAPAASRRTRADSDVRPVDASADETADSRDGSAGAANRNRFVPPLVPTPLLVPSRPDSQTESAGDADRDEKTADSDRQSPADSDDSYPSLPQPQPARALRSSVDVMPILAVPPGAAGRSEPSVESSPKAEPGVAPGTSEPPVESLAKTQPGIATGTAVDAIPTRPEAPSAGGRAEPPVDSSSETETGTELGAAAGSAANREPELELVQAPPAPKPATQPPSTVPPPPSLDRAPTPPAPPPPTVEKPSAQPATPATLPATEAKPAPPAAAEPEPAPAQVPSPTTVAPATETQSPPVSATTPQAPVSTKPTAAATATAQSRPSGAGQAIYASPPPMAPPQPRRRFLSLFFIEEKNEPLASAQFPAPTFPTSYEGHYPKPYPVLGTSQVVEFQPTVAIQPAKKPSFLKVWLHKMATCGRNPACSGCHHCAPTPCCSGCTCHAGTPKPDTASPQARLASPQAGSRPQGRLRRRRRRRSVQLGPSRATSRRKGSSSNVSRLTASTNRRSASSRCSATSVS